MKNDCPLTNPDIRHILDEFRRLCQQYDLAGACTVLDAQESGFTYALPTTFNAVVPDAALPLGFRIRLKTAEVGVEQAHQLAEGTAWTFGALTDFGTQTETWGRDLLRMLRQAGITFTRRRFGGTKLPHLGTGP